MPLKPSLNNPCPVCSSSRASWVARCAHCGWAPDDLLQASAEATEQSSPSDIRRVRAIWWAFLIAPPVAPLLLAVVVFATLFWPRDLGQSSTPPGFVALPLYSLIIGTLLAYFVAGTIFLPMIFALERRQSLSGFAICLTGVASWWLFVAAACLIIMVLQGGDLPSMIRSGMLLSFSFSPFVLAASITFAWIVRSGSYGMSLGSIMVVLTIFAILFACVAPAVRTFLSEVSQ